MKEIDREWESKRQREGINEWLIWENDWSRYFFWWVYKIKKEKIREKRREKERKKKRVNKKEGKREIVKFSRVVFMSSNCKDTRSLRVCTTLDGGKLEWRKTGYTDSIYLQSEGRNVTK